jgi:hypothetical protein
MRMSTDALPPVANAERLTEALRKSGALGEGRVCNVTAMASFAKLRSHTFRLRLDYAGPAEGAPRAMILKMGHLDSEGRPSIDLMPRPPPRSPDAAQP